MWMVAGLLLLATSWFVLHGAARIGMGASTDISVIYASARAWVKGENPYDYAGLEQVLRRADYVAPPETPEHPQGWPSPRWQPAVYPPTALVLLAPLGWLTYPQVVVAWAVINLLLVAALIALLIPLAGLEWVRRDRLYVGLLVAWALALGPVHSSLQLGQLAVLVTLLIVLGAALAFQGQNVGAGLLAALATGLKPQLGVILVLYLLLRWRWRALLVAGALLAALLAIGHAQMRLHGVEWIGPWLQNLRHYAQGGAGDPVYIYHQGVNPILGPGNPERIQLYNLQYPLHEIFGARASREVVNFVVLAATGLLVVAAVARSRGEDDGAGPERELLLLSVLSLAAVLSCAHRFYALTVLVLPITWFIRRWVRAADEGTPLPGIVRLGAVLLLAFPISTNTLFMWLGEKGFIPATITGGPLFAAQGPGQWWWRDLVLPAQVWLLALLAVCLVWALGSGGPHKPRVR